MPCSARRRFYRDTDSRDNGSPPANAKQASEFGATDVVSERGDEAIARVMELTGGFGVHSVLECVGTDKAMETAVGIPRPGGAIGRVGVPHYAGIPGSLPAFYKNVTVGGPAPTTAYIPNLLPDVLEGRIAPGRVCATTAQCPLTPA